MKTVLIDTSGPTVNVSNVNPSNKVYAYVLSGGAIYLASKLCYKYVNNKFGVYHYGFVCLSKTNSNPVYLADTLINSIKRAIKGGAHVIEFDDFTSLMKWKLNVLEDGE